MDREVINEIKSRLRLYDDDAKPLAGSNGQYTRLAIIGLRPERGHERHFTLFAQSSKLFDAIGKAMGPEEWVHQGFESKWLYIEEILHRPSPADNIEGYLQKITSDEVWTALFEYLQENKVMASFASHVKTQAYAQGLRGEDLPSGRLGLPDNLNPHTKFIVPKKEK